MPRFPRRRKGWDRITDSDNDRLTIGAPIGGWRKRRRRPLKATKTRGEFGRVRAYALHRLAAARRDDEF